jgi:hypothetical protein
LKFLLLLAVVAQVPLLVLVAVQVDTEVMQHFL